MQPLTKSFQNVMNPMGFSNQNMMNLLPANNNLNMMNQMTNYSQQNPMMPMGIMNSPQMNNQACYSEGNMIQMNNNMNIMTNNNMGIKSMNNIMMPMNSNSMNNQNNYFNQNNMNVNLNSNSYQNLNQNINSMNQNINNMNQGSNVNMNSMNNINQNLNNINQDMNQNINDNINDNPINNFLMNNPNINVPKETIYNEPINYQVSEETKKLLNNNEISRGKLISNLTSVSPTLQCSICLDLVMDPVECKNCSKLFCKYCIDNWLKNNNECPNKHIFEKKEELDEWIKVALGKIFLKCPFKGCCSDFAYKYWKNHVKKCNCKLRGCIKLNDNDAIEGDGGELFSWKPIQFFVKDIHGNNHLFVLPLSTTVKELKEKLEEKTGFKVEAQYLSCNGKPMNDNKLLEFYGILPNQTILQLGRLKGGS